MKEKWISFGFQLFQFYKMDKNKFDLQKDEKLGEEVEIICAYTINRFWIFKFSVTKHNKNSSSSSQARYKRNNFAIGHLPSVNTCLK